MPRRISAHCQQAAVDQIQAASEEVEGHFVLAGSTGHLNAAVPVRPTVLRLNDMAIAFEDFVRNSARMVARREMVNTLRRPALWEQHPVFRVHRKACLRTAAQRTSIVLNGSAEIAPAGAPKRRTSDQSSSSVCTSSTGNQSMVGGDDVLPVRLNRQPLGGRGRESQRQPAAARACPRRRLSKARVPLAGRADSPVP